jgi:hypothetical protein
MNSKEIKRKIKEEGHIKANIIFEVVGNPKEFIERALKEHLKKLDSDKGIEILNEKSEPAEKQGDIWSAFSEVELLINNLEKLTWICMNLMPASIEIMSPDNLLFKGRDLTNWLNDLLAKLHEIGLISQQLGKQNKLMLKNMNALFRNSILLAIDSGINKDSEIAKRIGVLKKSLDPVFQAMIKESAIVKKGTKYTRK